MVMMEQALPRPEDRVLSAAYDAVLIVAASLVVALLAQLSLRLPFTPVPVTGQTLAVLVIAATLGARRGAIAVGLYLAEGAAGLPFFAEGKGGFVWLLPSSPTGGYLWAFVLAAFVVGGLAERGWDRRPLTSAAAMAAGQVVVLGLGVVWLARALGVSLTTAASLGLYPFIAAEVLKLLIAAGMFPLLWRLWGPRLRGGAQSRREGV